MLGQFHCERVNNVCFRIRPAVRLRRSALQHGLDDVERQCMQPCAVAGKLQLIRGIAEQGVPKKVGGFSVHGKDVIGLMA
jgi:hypothetical protein